MPKKSSAHHASRSSLSFTEAVTTLVRLAGLLSGYDPNTCKAWEPTPAQIRGGFEDMFLGLRRAAMAKPLGKPITDSAP